MICDYLRLVYVQKLKMFYDNYEEYPPFLRVSIAIKPAHIVPLRSML